MIDAFNPPGVWAPFGAFSMAVIHGAGQIVDLKGQVALDREGKIVGPGDMRVQVRQALENVKAVLASLGGRMEDVATLTHHVTNIGAFMGTGEIRKEFFKPPYPATTTVEVVRLYHPDLIVEITATAEIPRASGIRTPPGTPESEIATRELNRPAPKAGGDRVRQP